MNRRIFVAAAIVTKTATTKAENIAGVMVAVKGKAIAAADDYSLAVTIRFKP